MESLCLSMKQLTRFAQQITGLHGTINLNPSLLSGVEELIVNEFEHSLGVESQVSQNWVTLGAIGARIWLPPSQIGMVVDRGQDFPLKMQSDLDIYGSHMWLFRDSVDRVTTRAVNTYQGDFMGLKHITPQIRITPRDLRGTRFEHSAFIHFICSPQRAAAILSEVDESPEWTPSCIYEPVPNFCVPEELPALLSIIQRIRILSPNADEALSLLSLPSPPTVVLIEQAAETFLNNGAQSVIIRSGAMGAYLRSAGDPKGSWIPAFFLEADATRIVDVTGAGDAFLGGLIAGLILSEGDLHKACLYATVSASYTIEQKGLPRMATSTIDGSLTEVWNGEVPTTRLESLSSRML